MCAWVVSVCIVWCVWLCCRVAVLILMNSVRACACVCGVGVGLLLVELVALVVFAVGPWC